MNKHNPSASVIAAIPYVPAIVYAQASPLSTGVTSPQENLLAWMAQIAILLVLLLGALAMAKRISWAWCLGAILGIVIAYGAPPVVASVRAAWGV